MSWFARLFKKKMKIAQIEEWLQEQKKTATQELNDETDELQKDLPELKKNALEAVQEIEKAELQNPNIPEKAKNFMTGNREQLVKLTNRFIENLFIPQENPDYSQMDLIFYEYSKTSHRPGAILSDFFGHEVKKLRACIAEIESRLKKINVQRKRIEEYEEIDKIIKEIQTIGQEKEKTRQELEQLNTQLENLQNKAQNIKREKEEFTQKPEYQKIKDEIFNAAKERQQAQENITELFGPLQDPLKKFAHKARNQKLSKYAENPVEELIQDYPLAILKYVDEIIASITKEELDLKPEKAQKALQSLKSLNKENLSKLLHAYANAKKRETDVHNEVVEKPIMKEYEQYALEIKKINEEIEQLQQTISKVKPPSEEELTNQLKERMEKHNIIPEL